MDFKRLKQIIIEQDKIEYILHEIGCKGIVKHDNYYSCGNYDGDNTSAINLYYDSEYLNCTNHTRDIVYNGSKGTPSIIDLVCFNKKLNLFQCKKYLCDLLGIDYYDLENEDMDMPESLKLLQMLDDMMMGNYDDCDNVRLQPISKKILTYYKRYVNNMFYADGISYDIQKEFEIGYDDSTNCITIPIRDELGILVGVKGRFLDNTLKENKYTALEKYAKGKILYGLYKTYNFIKKCGFVYVCESEKGVMQLFSMGIYNCVSTGGKKITRNQKNKLIALGAKIVFLYDKDVTKEEIQNIASDMTNVEVEMVIDTEGILDEKESPTDNEEKFKILIEKCILKIQ